MTSHSAVTPNDLRTDPELAILDALDHTLKLAVYALVAVYPDLTDLEIPSWRRDDTEPSRTASHLIDCCQELEAAIAGYRTAIRHTGKAEANQDLPF